MRSLTLALAALIGLIQSSSAHAQTPLERAEAFRSMRNYVRQTAGNFISKGAVATLLNQIDRAQARTKGGDVQLTQRGEQMVLNASSPGRTEQVYMQRGRYTVWEFGTSHSVQSSVLLNQSKTYYVNKGFFSTGSVVTAGDLTVSRDGKQITSFKAEHGEFR